MSNSTPIKSSVRSISTRSARIKSAPGGCKLLSHHSEGETMQATSSDQDSHQHSDAQRQPSMDLDVNQQESPTQDSLKSSGPSNKYNTRKLRYVVGTVPWSPKVKAEQIQKTLSKQIISIDNTIPTEGQVSSEDNTLASSNTTVMHRNKNILRKKKRVLETREDSEDDRGRKMNKIQSKEPVPGTASLASSSKRQGEINVTDNQSIPPVSPALHNYSKQSKGDSELKSRHEPELEKIIQTPRSKNIKVVKSSQEITTNIVEQVACYKCKFCLFLSLNQDAVTLHVQQEHAMNLASENNASMQCPGCSNVFYSQKSLKVHLSEDHNVASEELGNILKTIRFNISKNNTPQKNQKGSPKFEKQPPKNSATESCQTSIGQPQVESENLEISKQDRIVRNATKSIEISKSVEEEDGVQIILSDPLSPDETCKIRVRQLSSLEKGHAEKSQDQLVVTPAEMIDASKSEISLETDSQEDSLLVPEIHITETQSEINTDENIQMDIQYDFESMQILDIPLEHQQSDPQEQLVQQIHIENSDSENNFQAMEVVNANGRYCTISASPTSCEAIIDEICQEEGLEHVLYVEEGDLNDGRDSPLMVCFASNSDNENEESHHLEVGADDSTRLVADNTASDNHDCERMVLTNCTFNGTGLVGTDGKRLVKRGFVRRAASKKKRPRILNSHRKNPNLEALEGDSDSTTLKCSFLGCTVRLHFSEKMEYHEKCHVPCSGLKEESLEEKGSACKSKRGRIMPIKTRFECPECSVEVQTWKQMMAHLWKFHSIDMELYTCSQCGYKTSSLSVMRNFHVKIHGTEKPFLCDTCGKGFKTVKQLRNHKVIHVNGAVVKPCEVCGRTFNTNRMLRNHINTVHNKVRPYMCSECGHTAANRSSLKIHLRQHTGDRPYKCDQCEYRTADHNSLRRHKKRHTGDKPYKCTYCSYACIQSSTFKTHLRRKHPGQDSGLVFNCKKCPFHTVSHDIFLAHTAEHQVAEACGIPFKTLSRPQRKSTKRIEREYESSPIEMPIFVSIATDDATTECESANFEKIVQDVSEAIVPGSNLHVLYNSISFSENCNKAKKSDSNHPSNAIILRDPIMNMADDDVSELELVAEVNDDEAMVEMPSEMEFKLRCEKSQD